MAFKVLFTITAYNDLDINQINIKIAFLYRIINQLVYIQIPKKSENSTKKKVYKLLKVLYSLK